MPETIPQLFFEQVERAGVRCALKVKALGGYQDISWLAWGDRVRQLAAALVEMGIAPGDRVAILSENREEWATADLAIQTAGGVTVPVYPTETPATLAYILTDSGANTLFVSTADQLAKVSSMPAGTPAPAHLIGCFIEPPRASRCQSLSYYLSRGADQLARTPGLIAERLRSRTAEDLATIIYTSGTTGEPKGVMLTHRNFLSNTAACADVVPINANDVHLSFLPISHVFERTVGLYLMIRQGACIAYAESMDTVPENMREVRPTIMLGVPRFFEKLYNRVTETVNQGSPIKRTIFWWGMGAGRARAGYLLRRAPVPAILQWQCRVADRLVFHKLRERLGGRLRFFVSGSAPLAKEIAEFFYAAGIIILEGYGLTESSPVISTNRLEALKFGSVGQPLPGLEVAIAEDGEILTRGPHVMKGYYQREAETQEAIKDGWLATGDIGHRDADGFLFITDRKKDLLKTSGGKFVAPQKLEGLLATDPYLLQSMVYGDRQRYIVALIVPKPDRLLACAAELGVAGNSIEELVKHPQIYRFYRVRIDQRCAGLANYEQIKYFALLPQEFTLQAGELTPTMKVKRKVVAERYRELLQSLYDRPPSG
ncbi:MAG: long-chain fatty acid--CoA ligase [Candidatus Omnitrophica bacterium]|nr:long-chain fatty acid--CoA ligase [Candidatus Omnitrophota bacterium]